MTLSEVTIYCDGACLGNPGPGGYAALLMLDGRKDKERVVCGHEPETTNNRMELMAAIQGLLALKKMCRVTMYCDSQYVVKGMNEWMEKWQKSGFKNAKNKIIANVDLWQLLLNAAKAHEVGWTWVKAHAGNELNERVDEIAKQQAGLALLLLRTKNKG